VLALGPSTHCVRSGHSTRPCHERGPARSWLALDGEWPTHGSGWAHFGHTGKEGRPDVPLLVTDRRASRPMTLDEMLRFEKDVAWLVGIGAPAIPAPSRQPQRSDC